MKKLLALVLFSTLSVALAQSFTPASGMTFVCKDSFDRTYESTITDLGDESAEVKLYISQDLDGTYTGYFYENSEESFFLVYGGEDVKFTITFPHNSLQYPYIQEKDQDEIGFLTCYIK